MGLFSSKQVICGFCGQETKTGIASGTLSLSDGVICPACVKEHELTKDLKISDIQNLLNKPVSEIKERLVLKGEMAKLSATFKPTKIISSSVTKRDFNFWSGESIIEIDEANNLINFPTYSLSGISRKANPYVKPISEIVDFELIEDGSTITSGGSLIGAVAGGIAFGGAGAIVGSILPNKSNNALCSTLILRIAFNNINDHEKQISFINSKIKRDSKDFQQLYADIQTCLSMLTVVMAKSKETANHTVPAPAPISVADELLKYKQLLDMGAITQEEFDKKKSELL